MSNTPFVPEALKPLADNHFYEAAEELAGQDLEDYISTMPETRIFSRYNHSPVIRAAVYAPEEYDSSHALFSLSPFGNGHEPHMDIRNRAVQTIAAPNMQLVSFPNNAAAERYYELDAKSRARVASGDASPIAESIHATAEELGIETLDLVTYSQGTFVGVAFMRLAQERGIIKINNALIAEPTNIIDRTPEVLKSMFIKTGLFPLIRAVQDSAVPALTEAQAMRGPRDSIRLLRKMRQAQKGAKIPENVALHSGMCHDNMYGLLSAMEYEDRGFLSTRVTMTRAEKSKVTPYTRSYANTAYFVARERLEIDGYGHEAADNITGVYALLAKLAIHGCPAPTA